MRKTIIEINLSHCLLILLSWVHVSYTNSVFFFLCIFTEQTSLTRAKLTFEMLHVHLNTCTKKKRILEWNISRKPHFFPTSRLNSSLLLWEIYNTETSTSASYFDLLISVTDVTLSTKLYDKRDDFDFTFAAIYPSLQLMMFTDRRRFIPTPNACWSRLYA